MRLDTIRLDVHASQGLDFIPYDRLDNPKANLDDTNSEWAGDPNAKQNANVYLVE